MCKVTRFYFKCSHEVKLRKSQCGGTYHRVKRNGRSVACTADAYIHINLKFDCGPCQQTGWENSWKQKLEKARTFRENLAGASLPGVEEVFELVKELENEYDVASWNIRTKFPPSAKSHVSKVKPGENVRKQSPLAQEVRPDDVFIDKEKDVGGDDDVEYEPINYDNPLLSLATGWIDDYLPESAGDSPDQLTTLDFTSEQWVWGGDTQTTGTEGALSPAIDDVSESTMKSDVLQAKIQEVVKSFWEVVDPEVTTGLQQSQRPAVSHHEAISNLNQEFADTDWYGTQPLVFPSASSELSLPPEKTSASGQASRLPPKSPIKNDKMRRDSSSQRPH